MNRSRRRDLDNHGKPFACLQRHRLIQQNRIISGVRNLPGSHLSASPELGAALGVRHGIYLIRCIFPGCIEADCLQLFFLLCRINIGKKCRFFSVTELPDPAAQICLVNVVVIICRLDSGIENVVDPNICIIVGHVKIPIVPKFAAPAVGTDKRAIPLRRLVKIVSRIVVIPADDHNVMIWLLIAIIPVRPCLFPVIMRVVAVTDHRRIQGALNASVQINRPFNRLIILLRQHLYLLHMTSRS